MFIIKRYNFDISRHPFKGTPPESDSQVLIYDPTEESETEKSYRVNLSDLTAILNIDAPYARGVASSYFTSNASTTNIVTAGTYYKIVGNTIEGPINRGFEVAQNSFVRTGPDGAFKLSTTLTVDDGAGSLYGARYYVIPHDDAPFLCPQCLGTGQIPPAGAEQSFSIQATIPLRQGDGVEVWLTRFDGTGQVTVKNYNTIIHEI
jgi:hypothetical protein